MSLTSDTFDKQRARLEDLDAERSTPVTRVSSRPPGHRSDELHSESQASVMLFAPAKIVKVVSLEFKATPAWLVTPDIMISPPLANGLLLLTLIATASVAELYDTENGTGTRVVVDFFLTFLTLVGKHLVIRREAGRRRIHWSAVLDKKAAEDRLADGLAFLELVGRHHPFENDGRRSCARGRRRGRRWRRRRRRRGGGGGTTDVTLSGLDAVPSRPVAETWIAWPDWAVVTVSPVNVATPFLASTVVVKLGSPAQADGHVAVVGCVDVLVLIVGRRRRRRTPCPR